MLLQLIVKLAPSLQPLKKDLPPKMRIIIVEDNISVAKGIAYVLRDSGHAVDLLHDGAEADAFLRSDGGDVIVMDINLPGLTGIEVVQNMRKRGDTRPVLMLTARSQTRERIAGLDAGADDYLVKPFEMAELEARLRALGRRKDTPIAQRIVVGSLSFDPETRQVTSPDGTLDLPRKELSVFETMIAMRGRTVSKSRLLDSVYGTGADVDPQVVEVYVSRLRKRLKPHGIEIKVQRGLGYLLQDTQS